MQRAVYYNRVSTDDEDQLTSLANQKIESELIIRNNGWALIDGYIDEGKSGTTTKNRSEYNRLFRDMDTNKFDIIVIKDQSRLMRNTKEWYLFVDKLVQNNKKLYFYLEKKFYSPDDALITGIKAILAEDYSRSLSKNINNSHRRRQLSGSNVVITSKTWGYDKVDKKVVINEKEAEMVRYIYDLAFYNNYGTRTIAKIIEDKGYKNRDGNRISAQTIRKILRNPLYKGTAVMNIRHMDFETKRTIRNPEEDWIYHEDLVPAIVTKEIWEEVNQKMDERSQTIGCEDFKKRIIGSKKNTYPLSSKLVCGLCGSVYYRAVRKLAKGHKVYWCCHTYLLRGRKNKNNRTPHGAREEKYIVPNTGCENIHLKEVDMENLLYDIAKHIYNKPNEELVEEVMKILNQVILENVDTLEKEKQLKNELVKVKNNREVLLDKFLDGVIAEDIYKIKEHKLLESVNTIENELAKIQSKKTSLLNRQERLDKIREEAKNIADRDLSIKNLMEHIVKIEVYPQELKVVFDIFEDMKICVNRVNYKQCEYYIVK